ncbi:MAG: hypothetical protein IPK50_20895 [Fibrobacterota bacterium]|nr:hypothetical protein [Fibrobacterota bacterium]QQS04709.1 MAG: hypothetical protein IPK50_20895 [Fibrobacterota bacterium]
MDTDSVIAVPRARRGLALGLVLLLGVAILVVGIAMITVSGGLLSASVDSKQRIKSRMAARSLTNMQMAALVERASTLFGKNARLPNVPMGLLPTGDSTKAGAIIEQIGANGGVLPQEKIQSGAFAGMMGLKMAYRIHTTGIASGGAKSVLDGEIRMYQVPVFQFGVFYEDNLEICPGLSMDVGGPVHTNSSAFFRSPGAATNYLGFQGPVTAVGSIYQWAMPAYSAFSGQGSIVYRRHPDDAVNLQIFKPGTDLFNFMTLVSTFQEFSGSVGLRSGADRLKLPIEGASPRALITPNDGTESDGLARQKFASQLACNPTCPKGRWVNGENPLPAWITGPRVFFDRREQAWVKIWDFSVKDINTDDSVFYLADPVRSTDRGALGKTVINAFRIVNASVLPRNMAITSANPIYLVGDFNLPNPSGSCAPAGISNPPDSVKYCNAMIASDAFTLLSPEWLLHSFAVDGMAGSLERDFADSYWTGIESIKWNPFRNRMDTILKKEPTWGSTPRVATRTIRVNAAIMTGNKPSNPAALPPLNTNNGVFENNYEGGWHNTIRFLEQLSGGPTPPVTVVFKGSFVCMWSAITPGLNTGAARVIRPIDDASKMGYYTAPVRKWSFDDRFRDLANMPPATPFLATTPTYSYVDRR